MYQSHTYTTLHTRGAKEGKICQRPLRNGPREHIQRTRGTADFRQKPRQKDSPSRGHSLGEDSGTLGSFDVCRGRDAGGRAQIMQDLPSQAEVFGSHAAFRGFSRGVT